VRWRLKGSGVVDIANRVTGSGRRGAYPGSAELAGCHRGLVVPGGHPRLNRSDASVALRDTDACSELGLGTGWVVKRKIELADTGAGREDKSIPTGCSDRPLKVPVSIRRNGPKLPATERPGPEELKLEPAACGQVAPVANIYRIGGARGRPVELDLDCSTIADRDCPTSERITRRRVYATVIRCPGGPTWDNACVEEICPRWEQENTPCEKDAHPDNAQRFHGCSLPPVDGRCPPTTVDLPPICLPIALACHCLVTRLQEVADVVSSARAHHGHL